MTSLTEVICDRVVMRQMWFSALSSKPLQSKIHNVEEVYGCAAQAPSVRVVLMESALDERAALRSCVLGMTATQK